MSKLRAPRRNGRTTGAVVCAAALFLSGLASAGQAWASAPVQQRPALGVTADALPTTQIDGVVWDQVIVGSRVYAGGQFSNARPAGAAPGTSLSARSNLLAFDVNTGVLDTGFRPTVNGKVKEVAASPDGSRIYIAGDFTAVNGQERQRIAAFSTATGALLSLGSNPKLNGIVNGLAVTNTAVYVGGAFSTANGVARSRLAGFNASTGALLSWAPKANDGVQALLVAPGGTRLIAAGSFSTLNATLAYGLGAVDLSTGATVAFAANNTLRNYGSSSAMLSLTTDGTTVYGSGYWAGGVGNFEGVFAVDPATGAIKWLADCHGDTYDVVPMNGSVYSVSHHHTCLNIGSFPEVVPRVEWRANAFSAAATGTVNHNNQPSYVDFYGQKAPSQITWFPEVSPGTFTGQSQGAWSSAANASYLVLGGEFPKVNGTAQQGLVRFAIPTKAPNKQGPRATTLESAPTAGTVTTTSAQLRWKTNFDRDDQVLTYQLLREGTTAPVHTTTATSQFWNRPTLSFTNTGLAPGTTYRYRVRVNDPAGNFSLSNYLSVTTPK